MHHRSVGVKLCGSMAGVIRKLFNQVFVDFTEIILSDRLNTKRNFTEVFNQVSQQVIGQAFFVGSLGIAKHTV
jgi:hypothetical protein